MPLPDEIARTGITTAIEIWLDAGSGRGLPAAGKLVNIVELACHIEATARKPGNVHPTASFVDLSYSDFIQAGTRLGAFCGLRHVGHGEKSLALGEFIEQATRASQADAPSNVNLGIVLLMAPLVLTWREGINRAEWEAATANLVGRSTIEDAAATFRAIATSRPGGMGKVAEQDVAAPPTVTLLEAMELANERDQIAACYTTGFQPLFQALLPCLENWIEIVTASPPHPGATAGSPSNGLLTPPNWENAPWWELATIGLQLEMLAKNSDSLITRKNGLEVGRKVQEFAGQVLLAKWPHTDASWTLLDEFDHWLRADGHKRNPGTTADFIAATWLVYLCGRVRCADHSRHATP
jgi:triphosphoribosyl-dephospho-CoA synthase